VITTYEKGVVFLLIICISATLLAQDQKPPLNPLRITCELAYGGTAGVMSGIVLMLVPGIGVEKPNEKIFFFAQAICTASSVEMIGTWGNETANSWATFGGSILGEIAFTVPIWYALSSDSSDALSNWGSILLLAVGPTLGATIGFNMTRRYKTLSEIETGFINYRDNQFSLSVPSIYIKQEDSFENKTIAQRMNLLIINF